MIYTIEAEKKNGTWLFVASASTEAEALEKVRVQKERDAQFQIKRAWRIKRCELVRGEDGVSRNRFAGEEVVL